MSDGPTREEMEQDLAVIKKLIEILKPRPKDEQETVSSANQGEEGTNMTARKTKEQNAVLKELRNVAGVQFQDSDLTFEGTKLVIPKAWTTKKAITVISDYQQAQEEYTSFLRNYLYRPWDGAAAVERAIRTISGTSGIGRGEQSFFGTTPPARITVNTGVGKTISVPWGTIEVTLFEGTIRLGAYTHEEYGLLFSISAETPKKYEAEVNGFYDLVQDELEKRSIYKGQAFTGAAEPEFIDLSSVDPEKVIYSDDVVEQLNAHLWSTIEYPDSMRAHGIPLKRSVLFHGPYGCISGDAEMIVNRAGKSTRMSLQELVYKFNGGESRGRTWDENIPTTVQRRDDSGSVRLVEISGAWESGIKPTYTVTTDTGRTIRATDEHPFMTLDGWKRLDELVPGETYTYVNAGRSNAGRREKYHYAVEIVRHHPHRRGNNAVDTHRLIAEAERNGIEYDYYMKRLKRGDISGLVFIDPSRFAVHHIDGDHMNNVLENLDVLTHREHHQLHAELGTKNNVLEQTVLELVVSVELFGEEMTYDIGVIDEPHCFIADGFVVHNTGKTLGGMLTAQKAVEHGWTFILCRPGKDNPFEVMQTAQLYAPAVVFIEDIDTYSQSKGMSRDTMSELLDKFDGIQAKGNDILNVMTTNHEESITKGMLRPGRLDALIEIAHLDLGGVTRMVHSMIAPEMLDDVDYEMVFDAMEGYLPAFVAESITRAQKASIVRGGGTLLPLTTADLRSGAMSLRSQYDLMMKASEVEHPPTLDTVMRGLVTEGVAGMNLYSLDDEYTTHEVQANS